MNSPALGENTCAVEVTHVDARGLWLLLDDKEYYLPYESFPWFADATIRQITQVTRPRPDHLHWPELDIDLTLDMIEHPESYPLTYR